MVIAAVTVMVCRYNNGNSNSDYISFRGSIGDSNSDNSVTVAETTMAIAAINNSVTVAETVMVIAAVTVMVAETAMMVATVTVMVADTAMAIAAVHCCGFGFDLSP
jgi:hypothetical protein